MKVHVIGGGPAGLYFAILMKKAWPQTRITVFERNRPDDTFGFGVVFSDQTLETFETYDLESYRAIIEQFRLLGRHRDPLQGHGAPHRRQRLLRLLARHAAEDCCSRRAQALGVEIKFQHRGRSDIAGATARRRSRGRRRRHQLAHPRDASPTTSSRASICGRTSSPGWARPGRSMPSPSSSSETKYGIFIAHCYQYEPGRSTWVFETDPETFAARRPRPAGRGRHPRKLLEERVRRGDCRATS